MNESSGLIDQIVRLVHAEWLSSWFRRMVRVWFFRRIRERQFARAAFVQHWFPMVVSPLLYLLAVDWFFSNSDWLAVVAKLLSAVVFGLVGVGYWWMRRNLIANRVSLHMSRRGVSKLRRERDRLVSESK